jgi:hypothetical protein
MMSLLSFTKSTKSGTGFQRMYTREEVISFYFSFPLSHFEHPQLGRQAGSSAFKVRVSHIPQGT